MVNEWMMKVTCKKLNDSLLKLDEIKKRLEYALKHVDNALQRGGIGEKRNMLSHMNVAKTDVHAVIGLMYDVEEIMWEEKP